MRRRKYMSTKEFIDIALMQRVLMENVKLDQVTATLRKTKRTIQDLALHDSLAIPTLRTTLDNCELEIGYQENQYRVLRNLYETYERELNQTEKIRCQEYLEKNKEFFREATRFREFANSYKGYLPRNVPQLKEKVRNLLAEKGFVVDGYFEGDYATWIGVYARPKDKPTYLDPRDAEEAALQEKHSVNGFKQDFAEWFEWDIKENEIIV